jgi:hypothetical protein
MRSGRGFHNSCYNDYVKAFCDEMANMRVSGKNGALKYTSEEVGDMSLPLHWEFTKSPWYLGLLVKIFRCDPQLALHVADVMTDKNNVPVLRAAMRRERQQAALQERNNPKTLSPPTDSSILTTSSSGVVPDMNLTPLANVSIATIAMMPTSFIYQEKLLRAKMMASKAHAESTNIAKRMGKLEELKKGMALLKEMRSVIGEATYANGVRSLHAALPNFDTFNAAVDIIDVDNNTAPTQAWGATKRRLSSGDEQWTKKMMKRSSNDGDDGDDGNGLNVINQHAKDKEERSTTEEDDNGGEGNKNGKGAPVVSSTTTKTKRSTSNTTISSTALVRLSRFMLQKIK